MNLKEACKDFLPVWAQAPIKSFPGVVIVWSSITSSLRVVGVRVVGKEAELEHGHCPSKRSGNETKT